MQLGEITNEMPLTEWLTYRILNGLQQIHGHETSQEIYNVAQCLALAAYRERKGHKPDSADLWVTLQAAITATHTALLPRTGGQGILYTFGYTHIGGAIIEQLVALNVIVADIRYSPNSRVHKWRQPSLQAWLGEHYWHIQQLGNINYNRPENIELFQPKQGVDLVADRLLAGQHLAFMCVCSEVDNCHRKEAAEKVLERLPGILLVHL